ncbi:MAG: ISAs1 family transposase [Gammaproteobacteria bacterium]|jgi:predicted transposase YbfD/YdcC
MGKISIIKCFADLSDPRMLKKTEHKLIDIIVVAICAVICGADKWTQIEEYGQINHEWFKRFLELPNGIPSHDTFRRVFSLVSASKFQRCFHSWIQEVFQITEGQVIAIDGKSLRRSFDRRSNKAAINMVHAWATANGILLGQQKTQDKSNEITAIPELLEIISVKGCIVTTDAMGCQKKIADKIHFKGGDYLLAVKDNHKELKQAIEATFNFALKNDFNNMVYDKYESTDAGHGRVEQRACYVLPHMYLWKFKLKWKGLQSLVMVTSEVTNKATGEVRNESRYYISSLNMDAEKILSAIRSHWSVENNLHWCLDVGFREDECRSRIGDSAENFSLLRRIALMLLKKERTLKGGIQTKRLKAGWDKNYLLKILGI